MWHASICYLNLIEAVKGHGIRAKGEVADVADPRLPCALYLCGHFQAGCFAALSGIGMCIYINLHARPNSLNRPAKTKGKEQQTLTHPHTPTRTRTRTRKCAHTENDGFLVRFVNLASEGFLMKDPSNEFLAKGISQVDSSHI